MKVREIMSREVATCRPQDSLNEAAHRMWEHDVGSLPVVDDDGLPIGIITDRDVCMAAYTQGGALSELLVGAAMAQGLVSCKPGDGVDKAEERMHAHQVRRLPVVDKKKLVGIVSLNDLALAASDKRGSAITFGQVGKTLAGVCRHRQERKSTRAA
jgi:CBS domain-containing protein